MRKDITELKKPVRFICVHHQWRLGVRPDKKIVVDNEIITTPGKHIQFAQGEFIAETPEEYNALMNCDWYGSKVFKEEDESVKVEVATVSPGGTKPKEEEKEEPSILGRAFKKEEAKPKK